MSKHVVLKEEEVKKAKINPRLLEIIQGYTNTNQLEKESIKILDWGSGRGQTVAALKEQGYDAYGVEIDPLPYHNGLPYFQKKYEKPEEFLKLIDQTCLTPFPDHYFDIIFSEQVLEHVADLEAVSQEMSRITKRGGEHLHQFPAKWHLVEQHLYMPFVHWIPKTHIRYQLIYFWTLLGVEPHWKQLDQSSRANKAKIYYQYSKDKTYYRPVDEIRNIFESYSFSFSFKTRKNRFKLLPKSLTVYFKKNN